MDNMLVYVLYLCVMFIDFIIGLGVVCVVVFFIILSFYCGIWIYSICIWKRK